MLHTNRERSCARPALHDESSEAMSRYGTLGIILGCCAAMALLMLPGCGAGGPTPHPVDEALARESLVSALDHWKNGDDLMSLSGGTPPMTVQDHDWTQGARLLDYQIVGTPEERGSNLSVKVKLTLEAKGKSSQGERTVSYLVGTSPSITVFRDLLAR